MASIFNNLLIAQVDHQSGKDTKASFVLIAKCLYRRSKTWTWLTRANVTSISLIDYLAFAIQIFKGKRASIEERIFRIRDADVKAYVSVTNETRILDLANGQLRPQTILYAREGNHIFGIDIVNGLDRSLTGALYRVVRWIYKRQLSFSEADARRAIRLIRGDVSRLPLPAESFDLVTSVAALEHFMDVEAVLDEIFRILRSGGMAWLVVHSFTSLSGGHNVRLMQFPLRTLPRGVDPWDHLRSRKIPFRVPLNEWRIGQYREALSRRFEILKDYCSMTEGENYLTPEIEAELAEYSREELLCASHIFLVRKSA